MTRGAGSRAKAAGLGPCSVRPGEAWREQRLSCFSSSMPIMSKGTEEAPNSGEPGESTVSLHAAPRCWAQGCWGSACGWEGRKGGGRGSPVPRAGRVLLLLGQGAQLGPWLPAGTGGPAMPPSPPPPQPCPSAGTAGPEQALGTAPTDTRPCQVLTAAHACSLLPLQCACCAAGHRSTRTSAGRHLPTVGSVPTSSAW